MKELKLIWHGDRRGRLGLSHHATSAPLLLRHLLTAGVTGSNRSFGKILSVSFGTF